MQLPPSYRSNSKKAKARRGFEPQHRPPEHEPAAPTADSLDGWISQVQFIQSGAKLTDLPRSEVPEVAIAGRSNAGKSTALNILCQRKRLAFASKTPGRTRLINLFGLMYREAEWGRLVDLPGYGYAKVDKETQARWEVELARYLSERENLAGLILVTDIRHALGPLDRQMLDWFGRRACPVHLLLTKADKLTRQEQLLRLREVQAVVAERSAAWGGDVTASLFSGLARTGREPVLERISGWIGLAPVNLEDGDGSEMQKKADVETSAELPVHQAPAQGVEAGVALPSAFVQDNPKEFPNES